MPLANCSSGLSFVRYSWIFAALAGCATPAVAASRACLVSDVRMVTARQQVAIQLQCEGGRYIAGLLDDVSVYRGTMGADEITIIKDGPARPGQVYLCNEIGKTLPPSWTCALDR